MPGGQGTGQGPGIISCDTCTRCQAKGGVQRAHCGLISGDACLIFAEASPEGEGLPEAGEAGEGPFLHRNVTVPGQAR